jgi:UPF0755 protein
MIKKFILTFITLILICAVSVGVAYFYMNKNINQQINLSSPELITVTKGMSISSFSRLLVEKEWIESRVWLKAYVKLKPELTALKKGTYLVPPGISTVELLRLLVSGKEHQYSITFIEGTSIKQWLELLSNTKNITHELPAVFSEGSANEFSVSFVNNDKKMQALGLLAQQLNIENNNPEGYFYPDTYAFSKGDSDIAILKRAHNKMLKELDKRWINRDVNLPYKTKHEALTMASIIEKESGKYAEHQIIASVFVNRLHKKMRLQTDPTVIYGLGEEYYGDITFKHLRDKTPYNTRKIKGLTPTPITMPGMNALDAAFSPATTEFLYFVSNGGGKHVFSKTLKEHNKAVAAYLRAIKNN